MAHHGVGEDDGRQLSRQVGEQSDVMGDPRSAEPREHPETARNDVDRESEQESANPPWGESRLDRLFGDNFCVHVAYLGLPHLPTGRADRRRAGRRRGEFEPKLPERPATEPSGVTQFPGEVKKCALRSPRASRPERPVHGLRRAIPFRGAPAIESGANTDPTAARWCFFAASSTDCWWCARWSRKRSEEHTSELQSHSDLVCRLLLEKKKIIDRVR